jgi:hypothetical protein
MKHVNILPIALLALTLSSCYTLYTPNLVQIPLHQNKGEISARGLISTSGNGIQGSAAVTDNIAVMANYFSRNFYRSPDSNQTRRYPHKEFSLDYGVGYFKPFLDQVGIIELYGGMGNGSVRDNIGSMDTIFYPRSQNTNFKYFVQANIGGRWENFEIALANRLSFVTLNKFMVFDERLPDIPLNYWEPNLVVKGGPRNVKFTAQLGFAAPLGNRQYLYNSTNPISIAFFNINASLGLEIQLNRPKND